MYAVIVTGGKQYRVTAGDTIEVEKLDGAAGDIVKLDKILALSGDKTHVGSPHIEGALVEAQILAQGKGEKVLIFKKKRRHNYRRKNGHRQHITTLFITGVSLGGTSLAKAEVKTRHTHQFAAKAAIPAKEARVKAPKQASAKPAAKKAPAKKTPAAKKPAAKKAQQ
ncbi:MAG: 50S ribosomal protein L21 [Alphaproteobacteria bacterium]